MGEIASSGFWGEAARSVGLLLNDGSPRRVVLDKTFKMRPLVRSTKTKFTDFLARDAGAKACKVIVNGNYHASTQGRHDRRRRRLPFVSRAGLALKLLLVGALALTAYRPTTRS